jgi:hypothetical protein
MHVGRGPAGETDSLREIRLSFGVTKTEVKSLFPGGVPSGTFLQWKFRDTDEVDTSTTTATTSTEAQGDLPESASGSVVFKYAGDGSKLSLTSSRTSGAGGVARHKKLVGAVSFLAGGKKMKAYGVVIIPGDGAAWEEICHNGQAAHAVIKNVADAEAAIIAKERKAEKNKKKTGEAVKKAGEEEEAPGGWMESFFPAATENAEAVVSGISMKRTCTTLRAGKPCADTESTEWPGCNSACEISSSLATLAEDEGAAVCRWRAALRWESRPCNWRGPGV